MPENKKRVTIASVAARAGVSNSAVSKVLLGGGGATTKVSSMTAERIRQAAAELDYHPNLLARQLVAPRNNLVGVICDSSQMTTYARQIPVIQDAMFHRRFLLQLGVVHDDFDSIKRYVDYFQGLNIRNILCFAHSYPDFSRAIPPLFKSFPNVVFIDQPDTEKPISYAASDVFAEVHGAINYLAQCGKRRMVLYLPHYRDPGNAERRRGLLAGYADARLEYHAEFCYEGAVPELNDTPKTVQDFLQHAVSVQADALICPDDEFALRALEELYRDGHMMQIYSSDRRGAGQPFLPDFSGNLIDYEGIAREAAAMLIANSECESAPPRAVKLPVKIHCGKIKM